MVKRVPLALLYALIACGKPAATPTSDSTPPPSGASAERTSGASDSAEPTSAQPRSSAANRPAAADGPVLIRDADEYSFAIPPRGRPCVVFPPALFDAAACPAGSKPVESFPAQEKVRILCIALVRLDDHGTERPAQLTASLTKMRYSFDPPTPDVAGVFGAGMAHRMVETWSGATIEGGTPTVRLVPLNGVTAARISFDVDGAGGAFARFQHMVTFAVWAPEGAYAVAINSELASAAAFDALADELSQTIRLTRHAPPRPN